MKELLANADQNSGDEESIRAKMALEISELREQIEIQREQEEVLKSRTSAIITDLRPILQDLGIKSGNVENENHLKSVMGIMKEQIKNFKGRNQDLEGEVVRLRDKMFYLEKKLHGGGSEV